MKRHVALVGFMASGKSTIGRKLARKLGWAFADTDALVASAHGPIATIFEREGERAFRDYERRVIRTILEREETSVVALGGGALTLDQNRRALAERAYRVFIKVPPEQILARVLRSREIRPLLGRTPTIEQIRDLYEKRMEQYEAVDYVVDASRRSDARVIAEIVAWLGGEERALVHA